MREEWKGIALELEKSRDELLAAVRKHRDSWLRGDDKCWRDNEELYRLLPEGFMPPPRDTFCELKNCIRYTESCHSPNVHYDSPQRRIEELEHTLALYREENKQFCKALGEAGRPVGTTTAIGGYANVGSEVPDPPFAERLKVLLSELKIMGICVDELTTAAKAVAEGLNRGKP